LAEGDGFVSYKECVLISGRIEEKIGVNTVANEKIIRILQGNGTGGIIWKVNTLMLRNQWLDKGSTIIVGIISSLITLYVAGVLNL
jgi:hypothetical protein